MKLLNSEVCYRDAPVEQIGEHKFISLENRMLMKESTKVPCVQNFPRIVQGVSAWIRISPKVVKVPPPRSEDCTNLILNHHGDEIGLYTEQEDRDFEHISGLLYYKEQVTSS